MNNFDLQSLLLKIDSRLCYLENRLNELSEQHKTEWEIFRQSKLNRRNRTLWTEQQIADYLKLSLGHVSSRVVTVEDFPKPVTYGKSLKATGRRAHRRYFAGEIIAYFEEKERQKQTQKITQEAVLQDVQALSEKARKQALLALRGIR